MNDDIDEDATAHLLELAQGDQRTGHYDLPALVQAHMDLGFEEGPVREWLQALNEQAQTLDSSPETAARVRRLLERAVASHADPDVRWDLLRELHGDGAKQVDAIERQANLNRRRAKAALRSAGVTDLSMRSLAHRLESLDKLNAILESLDAFRARISAPDAVVTEPDLEEFSTKMAEARDLSKALGLSPNEGSDGSVRAPSGLTED